LGEELGIIKSDSRKGDREAVLYAFLFHTVAEVQANTEDWLEEYNPIRPNEALGHVPPHQ